MTTLENTISMMEKLPETDLIEIQDLIQKLFRQHESESTDAAVGQVLKRMSKADFMEDARAAEKDIAAGRYKSADEVFDGLEQRYGL